MPTVTLHKNCKISPTSFNVNRNDNVPFNFNTTGTLNFSDSTFFGQASVSAATTLTVQPNAPNTVTITVAAGTCSPTGGPPGTDEGDSCVITVSSSGHPHPHPNPYKK